MDARIVEQITEWSSRPFSGGLETLHALADEEFSGAVKAGSAWLFMLNGRVIGVFDGSLDTFEESNGTQFEAPHPSLPLLFSMQERGGTTQAKYYTNDTPLKEASETLASNGFTGYIELSENVLSGDYYVVYHGGRSMSAAYVGQSEQLITGDEAFSRANDEVGIYEVVATDVDIVDLPEPEPTPEPAASGSDSAPAEEASNSDGTDEDGDQSSTPTAPPSAETAATGRSSEAATDAQQATERNAQSSEAATPSEAESEKRRRNGSVGPALGRTAVAGNYEDSVVRPRKEQFCEVAGRGRQTATRRNKGPHNGSPRGDNRHSGGPPGGKVEPSEGDREPNSPHGRRR